MKRSFNYQQPQPSRRPLKVYAFDPMIGRRQGGRITLDIPNETDLQPGPKGKRIAVIDYDGANDVFYSPVDLDDKAILMQDGLEPTESDPRFHQQMVYAVAMKVLENFDTALGRKIKFKPRPGKPELRLFPHAFQGENAFYDPDMKAILFGYFRADEKNPGPNIPGQNVFTCLSQDIIAHEVTHAIVDRLRRYFREPTNMDVAAFHEGFSDIVAIFQHFTFPDILRKHIRETRGDLRSPNNLIMLASEFGYATGKGQALRSALDPLKKGADPAKAGMPDPTLYQTVTEPHERGSILVAAVFEAFFKTYQSRIEDLIRIATGGTGKLPDGDLHPDLVNRIAAEASRTAQTVLNMCIRAFEYLPPVDITFGDYLRALVTADFELSPNDESGLRATMIEAFRARGIYPDNVASLAEESLLWESYDTEDDKLPRLPIYDDPDAANSQDPDKKCLSAFWLEAILENAYEASVAPDTGTEAARPPGEKSPPAGTTPPEAGGEQAKAGTSPDQPDVTDAIVKVLYEYAKTNAVALDLDPNPDRPIRVEGFHPVFRVNPRGQLLVELVAQFTQVTEGFLENYEVSGGLNLRGGTTVIASANGVVRYVISKPLESEAFTPEKIQTAIKRRERQEAFVRELDRVDTNLTWDGKSYFKNRIRKGLNFKAIHGTIGK
jgi:hypothetical protein